MFSSLEILELDRNSLSTLSPINAPKLKQLNLDGNFLGTKLDKKLFITLSSLERLHLRDNQIEIIDLTLNLQCWDQKIGWGFQHRFISHRPTNVVYALIHIHISFWG